MPPKSEKAAKVKGREVQYKEVSQCFWGAGGNPPLSVEDAKDLLKWEELEDGDKGSYLIQSPSGHKVRCGNVARNRPFSESWSKSIGQDILNGNYAFNGENIVIGKTAAVLSGVHRLVGFICAEEIRLSQPYYQNLHPQPLTLSTAMVYGIEETEAVLRTLDNTRPRTLKDALWTSDFLSKVVADKKSATVRAAALAVQTLRKRTGARHCDYHRFSSNSELLDFLSNHSKLKEAIKWVVEEDVVVEIGEQEVRRISGQGQWLSAGAAAALLYLLGSSASDGDVYRNPKQKRNGVSVRDESKLNFANWDKAEDFLTLVFGGDEEDGDFAKALRKGARRKVERGDNENGYIFGTGKIQGTGTPDEKFAHLVKAWEVYLSGEKPTPGLFKLEYTGNKPEDLQENPTCNGIDEGWNAKPPVVEKPEKADKVPSIVPAASTNGEAHEEEPLPGDEGGEPEDAPTADDLQEAYAGDDNCEPETNPAGDTYD